ncbi:MAG: DNA recombination protein RmuC [Rhodospirillaceae bacterium]|jgi:DNA recombination protein RmuC|nr:DNA recombination protein RmuC [Rhodospirillaceae bacterium]MBT6118105.1 DNA recombination protein RmuC [Rhodospirillaceae bacterium]
MTPTSLALAAVAALLLIALAAVWTRSRHLKERAEQTTRELEQARAATDGLHRSEREALAGRTQAETRLEEAEKLLASSIEARIEAERLREQSRERANTAEREVALARSEVVAIKERMNDFEQVKKEQLEAAKAAALATVSELSNKLLTDHKRETESAKKETEVKVQKVTTDLMRQFDTIAKSVASLNDQVSENRQTVDTVWRSLSSPGGAGQFAEIGLENTLKSFGLQRDRDFVIQHTVDGEDGGGRLRPDAVVFLPGDTVLVIDSKASKFLLELAQAEEGEEQDQAYARLARSMANHLRSLTDKNYANAVAAYLREAGSQRSARRILTVMYLPNDGALEKLDRADPKVLRDAARAQISLAGPSALACLIGLARVQIDLGRQAENQEQIVDGAAHLLDSVAVMVGHAEKVGRGLRSASDNFSKFAGSVNSRLLPRARNLVDLGVRAQRAKDLTKRLPSYELRATVDHDIIDGEVEAVGEPKRLAAAESDEE